MKALTLLAPERHLIDLFLLDLKLFAGEFQRIFIFNNRFRFAQKAFCFAYQG